MFSWPIGKYAFGYKEILFHRHEIRDDLTVWFCSWVLWNGLWYWSLVGRWSHIRQPREMLNRILNLVCLRETLQEMKEKVRKTKRNVYANYSTVSNYLFCCDREETLTQVKKKNINWLHFWTYMRFPAWPKRNMISFSPVKNYSRICNIAHRREFYLENWRYGSDILGILFRKISLRVCCCGS